MEVEMCPAGFHSFLVVRTLICAGGVFGFAWGAWYYAKRYQEYGPAALMAASSVIFTLLALNVR